MGQSLSSQEPRAPAPSGVAPEAGAAAGAPASAPLPANVTALTPASRRENLRALEALLFAAAEPLDTATLAGFFAEGTDIGALIEELRGFYASRGVNLVQVAGKWMFRTAEDLAPLLARHAREERRLSRAALETLAIIAYHQPVTRAEIEEIRGVSTSKGTLDVLMETGWVRPRGRRRAPGKPITYGTADRFLVHFGFESLKDLPGLAELKGAGLLEGNLPPDFAVPEPRDVASLLPDELPLDAEVGESGDAAGEEPEEPEPSAGAEETCSPASGPPPNPVSSPAPAPASGDAAPAPGTDGARPGPGAPDSH